MKISGFTFLRNGAKLHYPLVESILSVLPIVDEFVVALGDCDEGDDTQERLEAIDSDKLRIVHTKWDLDRYTHGTIYAQQTDAAKEHCTGDWLLYVQGDEVIHEDDWDNIRQSCEHWLKDERVDAMLFDYMHFWGDYNHVHHSHRWYKQEMRLVRNDPTIHSIRDAQSFRRIPHFDPAYYRDKSGTEKLTAVHSGARIFHYGWVRPPSRMKTKVTAFVRHHQNKGIESRSDETVLEEEFNYGPLGQLEKFTGTHPAVMSERAKGVDWASSLNYSSKRAKPGELHVHERFKYRAISWAERNLFGGRHIFASRNYEMLTGLKLPRKTNPPSFK